MKVLVGFQRGESALDIVFRDVSLTPLLWVVCFLVQWRGRGSSHLSREKWRPLIGGYFDTSGEISYRPPPSLVEPAPAPRQAAGACSVFTLGTSVTTPVYSILILTSILLSGGGGLIGPNVVC